MAKPVGAAANTSESTPRTVCSPTAAANSPLAYGENELLKALSAAGNSARVCITTADTADGRAALQTTAVALDAKAESYAIVSPAYRDAGPDTWIVGRDETGAMYGALELAERVGLDGAGVVPVSAPIVGAPAVPIRGAQLYVILPTASEPTQAAWWLRDPSFWTEYLDLLAHARIDFLDLRGMYDLSNTVFPNALLYFATSATHPDVGVARGDRDANAAMLKTIVAMASARGIRVGFMTCRSDTSPDGTTPGVALTDSELAVYTREAVADVLRRAPGIWRAGVRIGESGHDAAWYKGSFVAGIGDAARGTGFYTRTWLTSKPQILDLISTAGDDPMVQAKYNGEQLGAPYVIAGGVFSSWSSYSYEDYLAPPRPYSFVFEVRTGGTHRIFRFASYARVARAVDSFVLGSSKGFALEPPSAYFPQRDFYHASAVDRFSPWVFSRDELQYSLFGRLAYDPQTPERVFRAALAARVGTDALWDAVQAASDIVPWIQTARTCGPDSRDFAADEEWGGPLGYWAGPADAPPPAGTCRASYQGPFDTFAIASPYATAGDLVAGVGTPRVTALDVARIVLADAQQARTAMLAQVDAGNPWARDFVRECVALADLGDYFGHKLRAATALAVYAASGASDYLAATRSEAQASSAAWTQLAADTAYIAPFDDRLRVGAAYHWRNALASLPEDMQSIDAAVAAVGATAAAFHGTLPAAATWLESVRAAGPGLVSLDVTPQDPTAAQWTVTATLRSPVPTTTHVQLLYKPLSSLADWKTAPLPGTGMKFAGSVPGSGAGAMFAVEITSGDGGAWRYPDVLLQTPYVTLPP